MRKGAANMRRWAGRQTSCFFKVWQASNRLGNRSRYEEMGVLSCSKHDMSRGLAHLIVWRRA
jgi:hypothetical protein